MVQAVNDHEQPDLGVDYDPGRTLMLPCQTMLYWTCCALW